MNLSFYTASVGAMGQQRKLDVIAANIANVSTDGYKAKKAEFSELLYQNIRANLPDECRQGVGARVSHIDTVFTLGSLIHTDSPYSFAVMHGDCFFALQDPETGETFYTQDGNFKLSMDMGGEKYLIAPNGYYVLDIYGRRIAVGGEEDEVVMPGVFDFKHKEGFLNAGDNMFSPTARNGPPIPRPDVGVERGYVISSNVDIATEMTRMMHAQRAYQMQLRMISVSDEIEGVINSLR